MKKTLSIILIAGLLFSFTSCITITDPSNNTTNTNTSNTENSIANNQNNTKESEKKGIGIHEVLSAQNFNLEIIEIKEVSSIKNALNITYKPDNSENIFIYCVIKATNTTKEERNVMNVGFDSYVDGNKIVITSVVGKIDNYMPLLGAVKDGKSFTGYTVWEVPKDWKVFEFSYIDALTGSNSKSFVINKTDIK